MPRVLLDTDILSEIIKAADLRVVTRATAYAKEHRVLSFTSVTVLEILRGLHRKEASGQIASAESVFERNDEVVPNAEDYRLAANIAGKLARSGRAIGLDPLIAACALRTGYGVASGNTSHFDFIRQAGYQFHLENWREP